MARNPRALLLLSLLVVACGRSQPYVADLEISPMAVDFGDVIVGTPQRQNLVIKNLGSADAIVSVSLQGDAAFALVGFSSFAVTSGTEALLSLTFNTAVAGTFSATLSLVWDQQSAQLPLSATAEVRPVANPCGGADLVPGDLMWDAGLRSSTEVVFDAENQMTADSTGNTYFFEELLSNGVAPWVYQVTSLDPCGALRWQTPAIDAGFAPNRTRPILVSQDRLIVQTDRMDAFDLATGTRLTSVDVEGFVLDAGFDLAADEVAQIGPTVGAVDGTLYLPFGTTRGTWLFAIDPTGSIFPLPSVPFLAIEIGGPPADLILDTDGQLDLLLNPPGASPQVLFVSTAGAPVFSAPFSCVGTIADSLAAGTDFVVAQNGSCTLTLTGAPGTSLALGSPSLSAPMVIDTQDNIYVSEPPNLSSFDASGALRWSIPRQPNPGGLVLGAQRLYVADGPSEVVQALDPATGKAVWSTSFSADDNELPIRLELTRTGVLVLAVGDQAFGYYTGDTMSDAPWPTSNGGADSRGAVFGQ